MKELLANNPEIQEMIEQISWDFIMLNCDGDNRLDKNRLLSSESLDAYWIMYRALREMRVCYLEANGGPGLHQLDRVVRWREQREKEKEWEI